jgi:hypothetical protein
MPNFKDLTLSVRQAQTVLGDVQYKKYFYSGMAFWGVGLALIRGWSLAIAHFVILFVVIGWFLL